MSDSSVLDCTPVVRKTGRGRGRSRTAGNRSRATLRLSCQSQASFEDSNAENDQENSRKKVRNDLTLKGGGRSVFEIPKEGDSNTVNFT